MSGLFLTISPIPIAVEKPGGRITDYTYSPRRWLRSASQFSSNGDSLTTTYEYDSRGRLLRQNRPFGGIKIYNHDNAGRLINIADNIDNSIDFTLDLMGNHLLEQVRAPDGSLVSQIRRTYDALGRMQQSLSTKTVTVVDVPTTTLLSSTDNPVRSGYPLRVTALVSGELPGNALPTGEVVFMEGSNRLSVQFLHDGKATLDISNLPLGSHTLSAFYSGDNRNHPSSSSEWVQVIQAGAASGITLSCPALSTIEGSVTCNANITTDAAWLSRLNGQALKLREGSTVLATGVLQVKDGAASTQFTLAGLTLGAHQFQAVYAGDAVLLASQSSVAAHTVQPHAPQITRLTLSGPLDIGATYEVSLPGHTGVGGYATYTVQASDTSLADVARQLADNVRAATDYQVVASGATITVTGPDKVAFTVNADVYNRPTLGDGDFFQQALAPRPGTRARYTMAILKEAQFGKLTTGDYQFQLSFSRSTTTEGGSAYSLGRERPIRSNNELSALCADVRARFPNFICSNRDDNLFWYADMDTPVGQQDWRVTGSFSDSNGTIDLPVSQTAGAESTILLPQPQIISARIFGRVYPGVVYRISAGAESWQTTSSAQDTQASILNGLAAAVAQSQQYVPSVVTARNSILNLQIASKTPVLPFTYSYATSNYPVNITGSLIQASR